MTQNLETMRELVSRLAEADIAYYKHDDPVMTDREYDAHYEQLAALERQYGVILSGSPTQKVSGGILTGLTEVRHTKPMLSAAKTKSVDEAVRFIGGRQAVVSWKLDGLTLVLRYEGGNRLHGRRRAGS
jgi:DNA ligase (NAD+)